MNPEHGSQGTRFALFASGASFSCEVLVELGETRNLPCLIVLPEFAPAAGGGEDYPMLASSVTHPRFTGLAPQVPLAYAPSTEQQASADLIRQQDIDFVLIACWPYLLAPELIRAPRKACLNLHPSLLPRYRGANPVAAQIRARERAGGVTLHLLDASFDHGDIVAQAGFEIAPADCNRRWIEMFCARLGVRLFVDAIEAYDGGWQLRSQPD